MKSQRSENSVASTGSYSNRVSLLTLPVLAIFILVVIVGCLGDRHSLVPETPHWLLDGLPAPGSASLQTLTDSILPDYLEGLPSYDRCDANGVWRIDTVGIWHGRTVLDMFYEVQCPGWEDPSESFTRIVTKAIAVSTSQHKYRVLYLLESGSTTYYFEPSRLLRIDSTWVLFTDTGEQGTGNYHFIEYWDWSEQRSIPRLIKSVGGGVSRILPPEHSIKKGGRFNIDSMAYVTYTWRPGDGNCCPTGGKLSVKYKLKDGKLFVDSASFDYSDLEPRALWAAERSEDSLYLKNPPRVYYGEQSIFLIDDPDWLYYNAYSRVYSITRPASGLDTLINRDVRRIISPSIYGRTPPTFQWQVDTLGLVHQRPVVRIEYSFECRTCNRTSGKVIAIELEPSLFRPIYIDLAPAGGAAAGDTIISVRGETLINVKKTGRYPEETSDQYWIWPDDKTIPVALYREWVLRETLAHVASVNLPEGLSVRPDEGIWDSNKLTFETYTWRDDDLDEKPGGGKLRIQFGIRDDRLVLADYSYDHADTMHTEVDIP